MKKKKLWLKNVLYLTFQDIWSSLAFTKVNKYSQTSTVPVDPRHLKVEVAEENFPSCSCVTNRTCYWLYVLIISHTHFRVNPHAIVTWMSSSSFLEAGAKYEV